VFLINFTKRTELEGKTMALSFEFKVEKREEKGKQYAKRLRREHQRVPAIIYGAKKPATSITLFHNDIVVALSNEAVYSHILTLNFEDGKFEKVVLKNIQRNPGSQVKILHLDFMRISAKEKLTMSVPLHFMNQETAPGVKEQGGTVSHLMNELEVTCLPANLPEYIEIDIGHLKLNESIHLSQITLPNGVELATPIQDDAHDASVVTIFMPRVEKEPEPETEEAAAEEGATEETPKEAEKATDQTKESDGSDDKEKSKS
jgi:large subunit ribosomal protein L25